jgi:hypothetical protein
MPFFSHAFLLRTTTKVVEVIDLFVYFVKHLVYTIRPHAMNVQFSMGSLTTVRSWATCEYQHQGDFGEEGV